MIWFLSFDLCVIRGRGRRRKWRGVEGHEKGKKRELGRRGSGEGEEEGKDRERGRKGGRE